MSHVTSVSCLNGVNLSMWVWTQTRVTIWSLQYFINVFDILWMERQWTARLFRDNMASCVDRIGLALATAPILGHLQLACRVNDYDLARVQGCWWCSDRLQGVRSIGCKVRPMSTYPTASKGLFRHHLKTYIHNLSIIVHCLQSIRWQLELFDPEVG